MNFGAKNCTLPLGSDKEASLYLSKLGIKGVTYDGRQDGRCYVIFDDKAVEVLKTYYQESNENEQQLIAGYTQPEVMEKLSQLYIEQSEIDKETNEEEFNKVTAKIHILEDAFEANLHPEKYKSKNITDIMLNAYYVMNNEEIPEEYIDIDKKTERSARDYLSIHNEKKEKLENEYYGYFKETGDKNIITIMSNANASTALHELGHLFYNGLVELSDVSEEIKVCKIENRGLSPLFPCVLIMGEFYNSDSKSSF